MAHLDRKKIAQSSLDAIANGSYILNGTAYDLSYKPGLGNHPQTEFFHPNSTLSNWSTDQPGSSEPRDKSTEISILEMSTLDGARLLAESAYGDNLPPYTTRQYDYESASKDERVAVLNFASAKKPGGGFLTGAQAQEESIARSSTLYRSLLEAPEFYSLHQKDSKGGYYSHAMIYSRQVTVFRDDKGKWVEPLTVDVVTSPAVNAGVVRKTLHGQVAGEAEEVKIGKAMKERMARILYLLERQGVKNIVLGSFGTGVFQNDVSLVAAIWAELLVVPGARFENSFDRVIFAILGTKTFSEFKQSFDDRRAPS